MRELALARSRDSDDALRSVYAPDAVVTTGAAVTVNGIDEIASAAGTARPYSGAVTPDRVSRWTSVLGGTLGGLYLLLGLIEGAVRIDQPAPLLFWLPALWGGGALVLAGVFRYERPPRLSLALVVVGVLAASLATAWTVLLPLFGMALVALVAMRGRRPAPA